MKKLYPENDISRPEIEPIHRPSDNFIEDAPMVVVNSDLGPLSQDSIGATVDEGHRYTDNLREEFKLDWNAFDDKAEDEIDTDSDTDPKVLKCELARWAMENNIALSASSKLLKILRTYDIDVPSDARTLYKTPRSGTVTITEKSGGTYAFFGVETCIHQQLKMIENDVSIDHLEIDINIDGLPIYKSRNISIWPIQVAIVNLESLKNKPFVVAMFCGVHKPSNLDFLKDSVSELKNLMSHGCNGVRFAIRNIICDAPARALVKGTVQFNGRYGCDFCEVRGKYDGRMMFLEKGPLRTNDSFRKESNLPHHKYPSAFLDLDVDMIQQFPIDPMHCVDLGVTKRLLLLWKEGLRPHRLSQKQIAIMSNFNESISSYFPSAFNRKPRKFDELKLWKATEFRTFLLYVGPVVLKWVLDKEEYELFLSLSIGVSILYNKDLLQEHWQYADDLLNYFVSNAKARYSDRFCAYNVHCLLHLAQVAKRVGTLENCSAYKFENNMSAMKRSIRGTGNPLVQVANRMTEKFLNDIDCIKVSHVSTQIPLKCNTRRCYTLSNGKFAKIHEVKGKDLICEIFSDTKPFFTTPCDSRIIGFHKGFQRRTKMRTLKKTDITGEAIMFPLYLLEELSSEICLVKLNHNL